MTYLYKCCTCDANEVASLQDVDYPAGEAPASTLLVCEVCKDWREHRRVFTPPQDVFYGPGFYRTDNSRSPLMRIPRKQRV